MFVFVISYGNLNEGSKPEVVSKSTAPVYQQRHTPESPSPSSQSIMFASPSEATASSTPAPTPKLPSVGEKATVGKFDVTVSGLKTASEFGGESTEDQFVIITV